MFGRTLCRVIQQTFIDVANLFNVEGTEGNPAGLRRAAAGHFQLKNLKRVEQVKHGAVADLERLSGLVTPVRTGFAAFEERKAVGIKERPAVGRQTHGFMLHPAIDGAEGGQKATPRVETGIKDFLNVFVRDLLKLIAQRGDGIDILVVFAIGWKKDFPFLRTHQENQPHHDRERRFI